MSLNNGNDNSYNFMEYIELTSVDQKELDAIFYESRFRFYREYPD